MKKVKLLIVIIVTTVVQFALAFSGVAGSPTKAESSRPAFLSLQIMQDTEAGYEGLNGLGLRGNLDWDVPEKRTAGDGEALFHFYPTEKYLAGKDTYPYGSTYFRPYIWWEGKWIPLATVAKAVWEPFSPAGSWRLVGSEASGLDVSMAKLASGKAYRMKVLLWSTNYHTFSNPRCGGCSCEKCYSTVYDYSPCWIMGKDTIRGRISPPEGSEDYQLWQEGKFDATFRGEIKGPTGDGCVWYKKEVIAHQNPDGSPQTEPTPFGELPLGHIRYTLYYGRGCPF